jgi:hypothetical protein
MKYCSQECACKVAKKFDVSKEDLLALVNTMPYTEIGKMYGVSDSAIRKRCKKLGIDVGSRQGYWSKTKK